MNIKKLTNNCLHFYNTVKSGSISKQHQIRLTINTNRVCCESDFLPIKVYSVNDMTFSAQGNMEDIDILSNFDFVKNINTVERILRF